MFLAKNPDVQLGPVAAADDTGTAFAFAESVRAIFRQRHRPSRRNQRVRLVMPLPVCGSGSDGQSFFTEAYTLAVSARGALIALTAGLQLKQNLVLINPKTREEAECSVVFLGSTKGNRIKVGIEFRSPSPGFWRMAFPPDGWNRAERKRPLPDNG